MGGRGAGSGGGGGGSPIPAGVEVNTWTGGSGEVRHYIENGPELIGLEIDYYKSRRIQYASLDGEKISNNKAASYLMEAYNFYLDKAGGLHNQNKASIDTEIGRRMQSAIAAKRARKKR